MQFLLQFWSWELQYRAAGDMGSVGAMVEVGLSSGSHLAYALYGIALRVLVVALVGLAGWWFSYCWQNRRRLTLTRLLPTVLPTVPLLGHLHLITLRIRDVKEQPLVRLALARNRDGLGVVWLGPIPYIVVSNPHYIKTILNSSKALEKSYHYKMLKVILGNGLLSAPAEVWKKTRRHLNPVFSSVNIHHLVPVLNRAAAELVVDLSRHAEPNGGEQQTIDVFPYNLDIALMNIIIKKKMYTNTDVEEFKRFAYLLTSRFFYFWTRWDSVFRFVHRAFFEEWYKTWEEVKSALQLTSMSRTIKSNDTSEDKALSTDYTGHITMLEALHKLKMANKSFGDEYVGEEVRTLLGTGSETSAVTMSACLVALGSHPNVQERLYEEVMTVAGDGGPLSVEQLGKMDYLEQVLRETLRRFCIIPLIARITEQDIKLNDVTVPAGSTVAMSLAGLHTNPDIYLHPGRFDPDRFSNEEVAKREKYTYLPFGGGSRDCIGKYYAILGMKIIIAHLVREYEIRSDVDINKMKFTFSTALISTTGYKINLRRRTQQATES